MRYFSNGWVYTQNRIRFPPGGFITYQYHFLFFQYHHALFVQFLTSDDCFFPHRFIRCSLDNNVPWQWLPDLFLEGKHRIISSGYLYLNRYNCTAWYIVYFFSLGLRSEGMIIFSVKVDFSPLRRESSMSSFTLFVYSCSDMLVGAIAAFHSRLFLISLYIMYILCNTNQASLGSIWFSPLCIQPKTFIIPFFVLSLYLYPASYFLFTCWMTLWAYFWADLSWITLPMIYLITSCITCCSSFSNLVVSLGSPYAPSIDLFHPNMSTTLSFSRMYWKSFIFRRNRTNYQ